MRRAALSIAWGWVIGVVVAVASCDRASPPAMTVFAAASLSEVLTEAGRAFEAERGLGVAFHFDASSGLVKALETGAPADLLVTADRAWLDRAVAAGVAVESTSEDLLSNRLALVARRDGSSALPLLGQDLRPGTPCPPETVWSRFALADHGHVPLGRYSSQALHWLGWWTAIEGRIIAAKDARATLRLVERGEADAGIVYATDAQGSQAVVILATLPEESHDPIVYVAALTPAACSEADALMDFLRGERARGIFEAAGYTMLARAKGPAP